MFFKISGGTIAR